MKLFKVRATIDIIAMAEDANEAVQVAKTNIPNETPYAAYKVFSIDALSDVPKDWQENIPYYAMGNAEIRKCREIINTTMLTKEPSEISTEISTEKTKKSQEKQEKPINIEQNGHNEPSGKPILEEASNPDIDLSPRGGPLPDNPRFGTMPGLKL